MIAIKKARLRRDGLEYGLPCVWLQDEGGTSTHTLLPNARPVPQGTGIREWLFNCKDPPRSLLVLASIYITVCPPDGGGIQVKVLDVSCAEKDSSIY